MKITTLLENTSARPDLSAEHGLSLYIETAEHRILFDMGQTALFSHNASVLGIDLAAVDIAILSHGHYDHVGGVTAVRQAFPGVPVYLHPEDADGTDQLMPTAKLGPLTLWRDGDVVPLGNLKVEVLHTPGHTPGSVCLRCRDALFTGDTLFAGSCGRTDLPGGDGEKMTASLKRLGELEGDFRIFPGHNEFTTLEQERATNPYLKMAMEGTAL